jgi:hypothetical protein
MLGVMVWSFAPRNSWLKIASPHPRKFVWTVCRMYIGLRIDRKKYLAASGMIIIFSSKYKESQRKKCYLNALIQALR